MAERINADLRRVRSADPVSVTQPAVRRWLRADLPRLARPTVSIKRPEAVGLRAACFLFRREPARARDLVRLLARERLVSRVELWRGETNVFAEILALDTREIDALVEKYEPNAVYELLERCERTRGVLRHLGRELAARN